MSDEQAVLEPVEASPTPEAPWWKLDLKSTIKRPFGKFSRIMLAVASPFIVLGLFNVKPLWEFGWRTHIFCLNNLRPVRAASGKFHPGGAWIKSKRIVVYGMPGVGDAKVAAAYEGMRSIVDEVGLDIHVERVTATPAMQASLAAATDHKQGKSSFNFRKFIARRMDDRGSRHAEMVVVNMDFTDPSWAWGLAYFPPGIAALREEVTDARLAKHEGAHLLGYDKHDDLPFFVFGYEEAPIPWERSTLMMILPNNRNTLSPRAHAALVSFWRGKERDGCTYFK